VHGSLAYLHPCNLQYNFQHTKSQTPWKQKLKESPLFALCQLTTIYVEKNVEPGGVVDSGKNCLFVESKGSMGVSKNLLKDLSIFWALANLVKYPISP